MVVLKTRVLLGRMLVQATTNVSARDFAVAAFDYLPPRASGVGGVEDFDVVVKFFLDGGPVARPLMMGCLLSVKVMAMGSCGPWPLD